MPHKVLVRSVLMWAHRNARSVSLLDLRDTFNRDHTTVMHALETVSERVRFNQDQNHLEKYELLMQGALFVVRGRTLPKKLLKKISDSKTRKPTYDELVFTTKPKTKAVS